MVEKGLDEHAAVVVAGDRLHDAAGLHERRADWAWPVARQVDGTRVSMRRCRRARRRALGLVLALGDGDCRILQRHHRPLDHVLVRRRLVIRRLSFEQPLDPKQAPRQILDRRGRRRYEGRRRIDRRRERVLHRQRAADRPRARADVRLAALDARAARQLAIAFRLALVSDCRQTNTRTLRRRHSRQETGPRFLRAGPSPARSSPSYEPAEAIMRQEGVR